ncbi:MAG: SDR family oxidoreductase [Microlunatus sp.]|nr:SDR family oxidoreductase [Microlunatus sp.]
MLSSGSGPAGRLRGRRVAVVGAAGGIGAAIVRRLAEHDAEPIAVDRRRATGLPARVAVRELDLRSPEAVSALVDDLYAVDDRPVDLVNSAGIVEDDVAAEDMTVTQWDEVLSVNLRGVFLTCQAFGRALLARGGGSIVNIASMSGNAVVNAPQRQCAYNTSKAGVVALTKSLAVEWTPRKVRVNAVSPGYIDTELNQRKAAMHEQWREGVVNRRFGTPEEVAAAVAFLLEDESSYFVGAELLMDGGYTLR